MYHILEKIFHSLTEMKYLAAYLLASLGGKETPCAADVQSILKSVEIVGDEAPLKAVID